MIVLLRVDDRLVHGQVVLGWGSALRPDRILLADDAVAANEWERQLYTAASVEIVVSVATLAEAAKQLTGGVFDRERVLVVVRHPAAVLALMDLGVSVAEANVGGLHFRQGRERIADGVFIDAEERAQLRALVKRGVLLDGRPVPGGPPVKLNSLVV